MTSSSITSQKLQLEAYTGSYDPRAVVVLTDSGYDNKKIQKAIAAQPWHCIIALGKTCSVQSAKCDLTTPKSKQWCHIAMFFRNHRWLISGQPFVSRRMGQSVSEWNFAPATPLDICATWGKSNWCAQRSESDRMVAASI